MKKPTSFLPLRKIISATKPAAANALRHVRPQEQQTWQVAYQGARAEAGLQHLPECLEWLNRAALSAPVNFAPLHLLRASALLAVGDKRACR